MYTYWIVKGEMSNDPDALAAYGPSAKAGDTEWQFSDGPPNERGSSADFATLQAGFDGLSPARFIMVDSGCA
jgi:hypothetical protein